MSRPRHLVAALVQAAVLAPTIGLAVALVPTWATAAVEIGAVASPHAPKLPPKGKGARRTALAVSAVTPPATPINLTSTGAAGATGSYASGDGTGGTGGNGAAFTQAVATSMNTNDPSQPAVALASNGGIGGVGAQGGDTSGAGGAGGDGGALSFSASAAKTPVSNGSSSSPVIALASRGGDGGQSGQLSVEHGQPGKAGDGGNGGALTLQLADGATVTATQAWSGSTPGTSAATLKTIGGAGGEPSGQSHTYFSGTGTSGADGGRGGDITLGITQATISSKGAALVVLTQGGIGGDGEQGTADSGKGQGGEGGTGGAGGNIVAAIGTQGPSVIKAVGASTAATGATIPISDDGSQVAQASFVAAGVQLQSLGARGGNGGSGDSSGEGVAGAGGAAGAGGRVGLLMVGTTVQTAGFAAAGVVAQSVGGSGGAGPDAGGAFAQKSGNGGAGGNGGAVQVQLDDPLKTGSYIATTGTDSIAAIAQSIGGGGGLGGSVQSGSFIAGVAIGGSGEKGGSAGTVSISNGIAADGSTPATAGLVISTKGEHSSALIAQSIGGGGGAGGSASSTVLGPFDYSVGGTGGAGGNAGSAGTLQVSVLNEGIVSTGGNHAKGMVGQAVGGGGGDGGSASSMTASAQLNITVAVGGSGGSGGSAGDVTVTNDGQIITSGGDAWGMLAQSVAGGGGNGGMSKSTALQAVAPGPLPAVNINVAVGGSGGSGGASGTTTATNNGVVFTGGPNAHGVFAQSISGGGGNGGDATALSASAGKGTAIDVTVAIGGAGGDGSAGGNVIATNVHGALIWTLGDGARGIFAQSVGGGGGTGGSGKDDTNYLGKGSVDGSNINLALGGAAVGGGAGGIVSVTSDGNILTLGDSSDGIFAQSIGGGGGKGGEASSVGAGGKNSKTIKIGGASYNEARNGQQSGGGIVTVVNTGSILSYGADATGIYAQSVGGGGGKAGTTTRVLGATSLLSAQDFLASSNAPGGLQTYADGVKGWAAGAWTQYSIADLASLASDYQTANAAQTQPDTSAGTNPSSTTTLVVGGGKSNSGDAAPWGDGGAVNVSNTGRVATNGPAAAAIFAQSIGGGGGQGGATDIQDAAQTSAPKYDAQVTVGGVGYNKGQGGSVAVTNNALVTTTGDLSYGIVAQSIGGGGGFATLTNSVDTTTAGHTTLTLGGDKFATGNGGIVQVNSLQITTQGNDAIGILAQSIGGGGGTVAVMHPTAGSNGTTTAGTNPGIDPTGSLVTLQAGGLNYAGSATDPLCDGRWVAACGTGGTVNVDAGSISTQGRNAHGIVAQSIGAGGGLAQGVTLPGSSPFANDGNAVGEAGAVSVTVSGAVTTSGAGAYGVIAQSIGGGGVLAGDLASAKIGTSTAFSRLGYNLEHLGYGGDVTVTNAAGASIVTSGANAPAIFAQSLGGGGGLVATSAGMMMGSLGGPANAGAIQINNAGLVRATGQGSNAIVTDSEGTNHSSQVAVWNQATGAIWGNASAPAILLAGEGNNNGNGQVLNDGFIANTNGTAVAVSNVSSTGPNFAVVQNNAGAALYGNLALGSKGTLTNAGYWGTNDLSIVGNVTNLAGGTIGIYGANFNQMAKSVLQGNLKSSGTIAATVDFASGTQTLLHVTGTAALDAGTISITPTTLKPQPVVIVEAEQGVSVGAGVTAVNAANSAVTYSMLVQHGAVSVQPKTQFAQLGATKGYSPTQESIGAHLDAGFAPSISDSMAKVYAKLANMDEPHMRQALSTLGNEGIQAAGNAKLLASHAFVERMNSCPQFDQRGMQLGERDCVWTRAIGNVTDRHGDESTAGYSADNYALQAGGQKGIGNGWFVGGSMAYERSTLSADTSNVRGQGYTVGLLLKRQVNDWIFSGAIDAGSGRYDSRRLVTLGETVQTATGSFDANHVGLHARVAHQVALSADGRDFYLKPYLDLHGTHVHTGAYQEMGGGDLSLNVQAGSKTTYAASPMVEIGKRIDFRDDVQLRVFAAAGATVYSNDGWGANASLAGLTSEAGTFTSTAEQPKTRVKLNAGVNLYTTKSLDVRLEYAGEFANEYTSNTGSIKAALTF